MSNEIRTTYGDIVGSWNGRSASELRAELKRISTQLTAHNKSLKIDPRDMPHRDQLPDDLKDFHAYPIWGCDKDGECVVGANADRIEPIQKVRAYSLVDFHASDVNSESSGPEIGLDELFACNHILIATDRTMFANKGINYGLTLAAKIGARVTVLSVVKPLSAKSLNVALGAGISDPVGLRDRQIDDELHDRFSALEALAKKHGIALSVQHEIDEFPAGAIVREAEDRNCDLIIMTSHNRHGVDKLLKGSQTIDVLGMTKIPVLVIR